MLKKFVLSTTILVNFTFAQTYEEGILAYNNFDFEKAFKILEYLSSNGNIQAQFFLAEKYKTGEIVKEDIQKAFILYEKAANQGFAPAQFNLGVIYYNGSLGKKDYLKAFEWFEKAANNNDAMAQFILGDIYFNGLRVERNLNKAKEYFEKAALQGHAISEFILGNIYYNGYGTEQNFEKAVFWYEKAALKGDPKAQFNLGLMYDEGEGVIQDHKKAFKWFEEAAVQGLPEAQYNLGCMYEDGEGVQQNYEKAFEWFTKAANQGYSIAFNSLGYLYYYGKGVEQDFEKANLFKNKALEYDSMMEKNLQYARKIESIFLEDTLLVINKNTQDKIFEITDKLKEKLDVNLYIVASLDNGISNDLSEPERLEALNKYYNYIKSNIDSSEKYILLSLAREQNYLNIFYTEDLISNSEKNEILENIIYTINNEDKNDVNLNTLILNGVIKIEEILNKKSNIEISQIEVNN